MNEKFPLLVFNSVLLNLAKILSSLPRCSLYANLPSFLLPSIIIIIITGDSHRPGLVLATDSCLCILELTVGF